MAQDWKTIRIFISSTFQDMHSERDYLIKVIFPALRERLEPHHIHLVDIDLRWGITEAQAEKNEVLGLCLNQIDECPFFIGLLGERYGWVPEELPDSKSKHGWTQQHTGKSVTEFEIRWGVLLRKEMREKAFFFFRDPSFMADVPVTKLAEMKSECPEAAQKLSRLKKEIRKARPSVSVVNSYPCSYAGLRINWMLARFDLNERDAQALESIAEDGLVDNDEYASLDDHLRDVVHTYGTVQLAGLEEFGRRVQVQLWEAICKTFELNGASSNAVNDDWLSLEQAFHERFMESRLRVYVGRESLQQKLVNYVEEVGGQAALLTGPSGSGKSATLARFVKSYSNRNPQTLVVPHFVGASPDSTVLRLMLHRFCSVLKAEFEFEEDIPQDTSPLIITFKQFVEHVPQSHSVVLVIDALNQLDEAEKAHQLYWLPWQFPPNVKLIVSCIHDNGREEAVLNAFKSRQVQQIEIPPLTNEERFEIVYQVPLVSAKSLDVRQIQLLLENPATENPLYLLIALEELRGFGSFEQLEKRIQMFPEGDDPVTELFVQVIHRLQSEFDSVIVKQVLSLLASARRGLSDRELLDLIEGINASVGDSQSDLFPTLRQLRPYLQYRGNLWDFFHRNLYKAVCEKFLNNNNSRSTVHSKLSEYFKHQDYFSESLEDQRKRANRYPPSPRPVNIRKVDELPFHMTELARLNGKGDAKSPYWDRLVDLLSELDYLEAKAEVKYLIYDLLNDYADVLKAMPREHPRYHILKLLNEAIRRDVGFIARHREDYPQALFQSLWNTCWWYDCPDAAEHYAPPEGGWSDQGPPWSRSQPRLYTLLERWRQEREDAFPGFTWIRDKRPPKIHLGTAQRAVLQGHADRVSSVAWSPDARYFVSANSLLNREEFVGIWDVSSGMLVKKLRGDGTAVTTARYSPDGQQVVSAYWDNSVRIWDACAGDELAKLKVHHRSNHDSRFSDDGSLVVSGNRRNDGEYTRYDTDSGVLLNHDRDTENECKPFNIALPKEKSVSQENKEIPLHAFINTKRELLIVDKQAFAKKNYDDEQGDFVRGPYHVFGCHPLPFWSFGLAQYKTSRQCAVDGNNELLLCLLEGKIPHFQGKKEERAHTAENSYTTGTLLEHINELLNLMSPVALFCLVLTVSYAIYSGHKFDGLVSGVVFGILGTGPLLALQAWRFVKPGLYKSEYMLCQTGLTLMSLIMFVTAMSGAFEEAVSLSRDLWIFPVAAKGIVLLGSIQIIAVLTLIRKNNRQALHKALRNKFPFDFLLIIGLLIYFMIMPAYQSALFLLFALTVMVVISIWHFCSQRNSKNKKL